MRARPGTPPAAVLQEERGCGAKARPAGAGHRPLPTSSAFARGGGSSSQMSSPGNTMPLTRLPSASMARKTLAEPEGDARCRWRPSIARPAVSNERLSVNDRGQVVCRLEHPLP